jgi:hypothetical protein
VEYKKGRENRAADALSRRDWPEVNPETTYPVNRGENEANNMPNQAFSIL